MKPEAARSHFALVWSTSGLFIRSPTDSHFVIIQNLICGCISLCSEMGNEIIRQWKISGSFSEAALGVPTRWRSWAGWSFEWGLAAGCRGSRALSGEAACWKLPHRAPGARGANAVAPSEPDAYPDLITVSLFRLGFVFQCTKQEYGDRLEKGNLLCCQRHGAQEMGLTLTCQSIKRRL